MSSLLEELQKQIQITLQELNVEVAIRLGSEISRISAEEITEIISELVLQDKAINGSGFVNAYREQDLTATLLSSNK